MKCRKTLAVLLACIALCTALFGCGKKEVIEESIAPTKEAEVQETAAEIITIESEPETEGYVYDDSHTVKDGKVRSYLTGEWVDASIGNRRPIAVMMSNDKAAAPQYGMHRAGVIYEAPVEGELVRFMSVIEDYDDLTRIGSVRSCRTYYTYFAREWDAVYAHYGQSTFALPYLENVDNINGVEGKGSPAYYRSNDKKAPHNAYTSAEGLKKTIEKLGYRNEYADDYSGHFKFADEEHPIELDPAASLEAFRVYPGYPYNEPWFEYSDEDGLYHRFQYGDKHMSDEGEMAVKNVIIQYSPAGTYADTQYLNINVHEDTYGYFFTGGRGIPVSVKKDGEFGVTHYFDAEGNEIRLNPGKTWICIVQSHKFDKTEIYDKNGVRTDK